MPGFLFGCYAGMFLTAFALLLLRRKTWRQVKYDSARWARRQTERKLHPARVRYTRIATGVVVWVPSALAAVVLFFFPVASHVLHPGSRYLGSYRFPIPWTYTVLPSPDNLSVNAFGGSAGRGRFGVTPLAVPPFWRSGLPVSYIHFSSNSHDAFDMKKVDASQLRRRDFRLSDFELTCWQHRPQYVENWQGDWFVDCQTAAPSNGPRLYAGFSGREQDLPAFYQIVGGVTPVNH